MAKTPDSFEHALRDVLPILDEQMATIGTPVQDRPLLAARQIVDIFVLEVHGDTKENYIEKPWFAQIFKLVRTWYEKRYGEAVTKSRQATALGIFHFFGTPYLLRVPLVLSKPVGDGTAWIHFPTEVQESEDPFSWVQPLLPKDITAKRKASVTAVIIQVAILLRSININLNTADLAEPDQRSMARSIIRHLGKAASDITTDDRSDVSLAVWEIHMACEKAMKVYLSQKKIDYPFDHDLRKLQRLASSELDWSDAKLALATMPSERRVMDWRYSKGTPPTPKELDRMYTAALQLCSIYSKRLTHTLKMENAAFHISQPPWFGNA